MAFFGKLISEILGKNQNAYDPNTGKYGSSNYNYDQGTGRYTEKTGLARILGMKKGGKVKSASARADGCAQRGKTRGKVV